MDRTCVRIILFLWPEPSRTARKMAGIRQRGGRTRRGVKALRDVCLLVSYDGTAYNGYQSQPGGNTIQDKLEEAIEQLTGERTRVTGSGRTDAGVHARGQVVNFPTESRIPIERWALALNARLPNDIVVRDAIEVPPAFHSRHDAIRKTYRYTIRCDRFPDVFTRHYALHHHAPLRFDAMREGLKHLLGEHDFTSFATPGPVKPHYVRTIYDARLTVENEGEKGEGRGTAHLFLTGNGFLYNMVRIIAGTLLQVGEGKREPSDIARILAAKDRTQAGPTAPPHGLVLWQVEYAAEWGIVWNG